MQTTDDRRDRSWVRRGLAGLTALTIVVGAMAVDARAAAADGAIAAQIEAIFTEARGTPLAPPVQREREPLAAFYGGREYRPLWVSASGPVARARSLVALLERAEEDGLDAEHYGPGALEARFGARSPHELAALDVLMSAELLHFLGELRRGHLSAKAVDPELFVFPDDFDRLAALEAAAATDDVGGLAERNAPQMRPYGRLKRALAELRATAAKGGWPAVAEGPSLKLGMSDPRIAVLHERLVAGGDLPAVEGNPLLFDAALEASVVRFQNRHGLEPDGVVGKNTLRALNVSASERIRQIELNLERWRWMPEDLGDRHILVNIAGFEVDVVEDGETALHMRAVVGRTYRRTPVFSETMTYLEFNPTWTVPPNIARLDILPKVKENPAYLGENGFKLYAGWTDNAPPIDPAGVDWQAVDARHLSFRFVQQPGAKNALGRVKFMFPNRFNVYLHDTPSRELFARAVRTFSSGCIRIEKPLELARYLLTDVPGWDAERIETVLASGRLTRVSLNRPIRTHLTYATAWVDDDGVLQFRDDLYGRDAVLAEALFGSPALH